MHLGGRWIRANILRHKHLQDFRIGRASGESCDTDGVRDGERDDRTGDGRKPREHGGENGESAPDRDVTLSTALHTAPPRSLSHRCTRSATLCLKNLLLSTLKLSREPLLIREFMGADVTPVPARQRESVPVGSVQPPNIYPNVPTV